MHEELFGTVDRITFRATDSGFTVAWLRQPKVADPLCLVGTMPDLSPGESIRCKGSFRHHPAHGLQFQVLEYSLSLPTDSVGIQRYLESGMIRGVGKKLAERIVDAFGPKTLDIMDTDPNRLLDVEGIGAKKLEQILAAWQEQRAVREVMVFLQGHGVSPAYAQKIFRHYGEKAIQKVSENPYRLARDIHGVGFKTADQIAEKLGIHKGSAERLRAGLEFVLEHLSNEGHTCAPIAQLIEAAELMLEVPQDRLFTELKWLQDAERVIVQPLAQQGEHVWSKLLWACEQGIVREIDRVLQAPCRLRSIDIDKALVWVQQALGIELATGQAAAVRAACEQKVLVITGGPGTGKSTITNAILTITGKLSSRILLAAPTGRAAKRMSEITGQKASTIHSLLEMDFANGGFKRGRDHPLDCDLLVVDEASMIDTHLMFSLLKAVPSQARLLLVGDVDQLPSVGPGSVLRDLIDSKLFTVSHLTEIFRQAAGSRIITNAHAINRGDAPDLSWDPRSDFLFYPVESPEGVRDKVLQLVHKELPQARGFQAIEEIQVLAPMKKGVVGTENLNLSLQEILNPKGGEAITRMGRRFLKGDKVMQIRNNYDKNVFNGDVGRIVEIEHADQFFIVRYDDREVEYEFSEVDELVLAYAVSVHKYQGSETPCVVMPVHTTHFKMLQRNLLYTGITRGKRCVVLVGTKKALHMAVQACEAGKRSTGLRVALEGKRNALKPS
jgi:exodeoxyribonuclease V alpha subunit